MIEFLDPLNKLLDPWSGVLALLGALSGPIIIYQFTKRSIRRILSSTSNYFKRSELILIAEEINRITSLREDQEKLNIALIERENYSTYTILFALFFCMNILAINYRALSFFVITSWIGILVSFIGGLRFLGKFRDIGFDLKKVYDSESIQRLQKRQTVLNNQLSKELTKN